MTGEAVAPVPCWDMAWGLVIHGGAGAIAPGVLTAAQEAAYRGALGRIAELGARLLAGGATALDTVEAAVRELENDPLFNAGRGAVFGAEGRNELDAAIMDGISLAAGAVAGVGTVANPVSLARGVMENSPHVLLAGMGAEAFARHLGTAAVPPGYFFTEGRWRALEKFLAARGLPVPPRPDGLDVTATDLVHDEGARGTVGAVARDAQGHLAAATSTGGITGKRWGRVGDSPIIGAGCYASDASCAVSCTGTGEIFIRLGVAQAIAARVALLGESLEASSVHAVAALGTLGGEGGVIAIGPDGEGVCQFNTDGMYRARVSQGSPLEVALYDGDA